MLLNTLGCLEKFNKLSHRKTIVNRGGKGRSGKLAMGSLSYEYVSNSKEYGVGNISINLTYW